MKLHVGIDDTDSPSGMCTTYLGASLAAEFVKRGYKFIDFPCLVRLNPNIPLKTRGNGAISLHVEATCDLDEVEELIEEHLVRHAHRHGKTDPTAVLLTGPPELLRAIYQRALTELLPPSIVERTLRTIGARVIGNAKGRGVIGAAASIGAFGINPHSYELLLYTHHERVVERRCVKDDIIELDRLLRPLTFANVDYSTNRVLAAPRGSSPVVAGIRSLNPLVLSSITPYLARRWGAQLAVIYKTNQATACHLATRKLIKQLRPYDSVVVKGLVKGVVATLPGGHVLLTINDDTGTITCAVFRETGFLAKVAKQLREGDTIEVGGGIQPRSNSLTLNAEYIRVISIAPAVATENPMCPVCGKRLKSAGRGKGFKCESCGYRTLRAKKATRALPRPLEPGLHLPSSSAYRHLSIPRELFGLNPLPAPPIPQLFLWPYPPP